MLLCLRHLHHLSALFFSFFFSFFLIAAVNRTFKYLAVVRKKEERAALPGHECDQCKKVNIKFHVSLHAYRSSFMMHWEKDMIEAKWFKIVLGTEQEMQHLIPLLIIGECLFLLLKLKIFSVNR